MSPSRSYTSTICSPYPIASGLSMVLIRALIHTSRSLSIFLLDDKVLGAGHEHLGNQVIEVAIRRVVEHDDLPLLVGFVAFGFDHHPRLDPNIAFLHLALTGLCASASTSLIASANGSHSGRDATRSAPAP